MESQCIMSHLCKNAWHQALTFRDLGVSTIKAGECIFYLQKKNNQKTKKKKKQLCANSLAKELKAFDFQRHKKGVQKGLLFHRIQVPFNLASLLSGLYDMAAPG